MADPAPQRLGSLVYLWLEASPKRQPLRFTLCGLSSQISLLVDTPSIAHLPRSALGFSVFRQFGFQEAFASTLLSFPRLPPRLVDRHVRRRPKPGEQPV